MHPLTLGLSIYEQLGLENPPVGIEFLFDKADAIEPLDKKVAFCEMVGEPRATS